MNETKTYRLSKLAKEFNQSVGILADFLSKNGHKTKADPNEKISEDAYNILLKEFAKDKLVKDQAEQIRNTVLKEKKDTIDLHSIKKGPKNDPPFISGFSSTSHPSVTSASSPPISRDISSSEKDPKVSERKKTETIDIEIPKLPGITEVGKKTDLPSSQSSSTEESEQSSPDLKPPTERSSKDPSVQEDNSNTPPIEHIAIPQINLSGPTILGTMELKDTPKPQRLPTASEFFKKKKEKQKRKRIKSGKVSEDEIQKLGKQQEEKDRQRKILKYGDKDTRHKTSKKTELTDEEIQQQLRDTLAKLTEKSGKSKSAKLRREKREQIRERLAEEEEKIQAEKQILKVTEFLTANELASMMNIQVSEVIKTCMMLGIIVSINQRLDAETITIVAEEFGFKTKFVTVDDLQEEEEEEEESRSEDLVPRPPIITIMGHVDHGKTSLIDFIRKSNVVAGEAGGITQHIGSYNVQLENGRSITILDTPGHEAFTAMRARGAKITDIAIIVIAADDGIMPQTKEAINHAQAAGVPMIFAINKIDKPGANPNKIKEELANMNLLVEEWGGKYQSQEISAKAGTNIDLLLEKVLLEADIMDLKANPRISARGTIIEARLDKGKGHVADLIVQQGTLRVGDIILAGPYSGRVKAMLNERGHQVQEAGPSMPVQILGLDGSPAAGDEFRVLKDERKAREIANKRLQLLREQGLRTKKHITLDEIGRRLAVGDFKELNIIVKGDVDGSIEALSDALIKLSTEKIAVNIIHKSVGAINESDVMLASASDAIIVGFQVRPTPNARKLAETEQIDIRLYSIIYNAIEEIKSAMEGMLSPEFKEKVVCNVEVREIFKISKVGTVAGCYVKDGKITRSTKIRLIRDGIVVYEGVLGSLKRFKDDVKEVTSGFECGLNIENFNDIKVGDIIEGYELVEVKATL